MKKRIIAGVMALTMMSLVLAGCGAKTEDSTADTTKAAAGADTSAADTGKKLKIGISVDQLFESRVASVMAGEKVAEAAGCEIIELVADGDAQVQNNQIQTLINQGVDGLFICPVDMSTIETALLAAKAKGIPTSAFDRNAPDSTSLVTYTGCNALEDGYMCGKGIADELKKTGEGPWDIVEFVGALNDAVGIDRGAGFHKAIDELLGDKANVISIPTNWDSQTALAGLQSAYQANPNIAAIFCATDTFMPVCETVLTDLGKLKLVGEPGHVVITGINGSLDAYDSIVKGVADGMLCMNNGIIGGKAMEYLLDAIAGKEVPREEVIDGSYYTPENIEANKDNIWGLWDLKLSYQQ